ncbi:hypothetical protein ACROYT_G028567 [Oculina patagonica]
MVAIRKPSGKLRICIDPKDLNQALKRSHYPMPTIEEVLLRLSNAKVFSVLDAKDGFWQVKLQEESSYLTTFWTPFGRFRWLRMPFGISTALEDFQRWQHEVLEGLPGVEVIADDILVYGSGDTKEQADLDHDRNLIGVLERARLCNLKLNKQKLKLRLTEVPYMGHLLTSDGLRPDPQKVQAVIDMPKPDGIKAVQRFLGFVNYLSKFLPHISGVCEPLRRLTDKDSVWCWQSQHDEAMESIKKLVTTQPILRYYDVKEEKYNLNVTYKRGKEMYLHVADTLSRAAPPQMPTSDATPGDQIFNICGQTEFEEEIESINQTDFLKVTDSRLKQIQQQTVQDTTLQVLKSTILSGWPETKEEVPVIIREYWAYRDELTAQNGVLFKGSRIIIPKSMHSEMLVRIHSSHLGAESCLRKARDVLYWPNMSNEVRDMVGQCSACNEYQHSQCKEPLMTHEIPECPWSRVAMDIFTLDGED